MSEFFTFDIASGIAICFTAYAVYLQRQELKLQREEITLNRKELEGQKEQTKRLADLTEQTAKATRLQTEIAFCKKIEVAMIAPLNLYSKNIDSNESIIRNFIAVAPTASNSSQCPAITFIKNGFLHSRFETDGVNNYIKQYEKIKNYLKEDSQLYDYYLSESSPFTVLYEKSKMVSDR